VNMADGPSTYNNYHHAYKRILSPCVGEPFETFCEEDNEHNKFAVAVHLNNRLTVVGHIPRERGQCCTAACGGVEVPCLLKFYHVYGDTRVLGELVTKKFVLA